MTIKSGLTQNWHTFTIHIIGLIGNYLAVHVIEKKIPCSVSKQRHQDSIPSGQNQVPPYFFFRNMSHYRSTVLIYVAYAVVKNIVIPH